MHLYIVIWPWLINIHNASLYFYLVIATIIMNVVNSDLFTVLEVNIFKVNKNRETYSSTLP